MVCCKHTYLLTLNDSVTSVDCIHDATFLAEKMNSSCTLSDVGVIIKPSVPNAMMTPSQSVTVIDHSSTKDYSVATLVWVLVSVVIFFAIVVVTGITLFIVHKKTKKQQLTEFAKSRSAMLLCSFCYYFLIMCSEESDLDVSTRYASIGKQSCTLAAIRKIMLYSSFVDDARRSSIEELQKTLPRNMVFSSHQIRLSNTVGQGIT